MSEDQVAVRDRQPLEQFTIPVYVFQHVAKLSNPALRVYLALLWLTRTSNGFSSLREIAAVAGISPDEVDPAVVELQDAGLAKKVTETRGVNTTYYLTKPGA